MKSRGSRVQAWGFKGLGFRVLWGLRFRVSGLGFVRFPGCPVASVQVPNAIL